MLAGLLVSQPVGVGSVAPPDASIFLMGFGYQTLARGWTVPGAAGIVNGGMFLARV
jgi:hypothetical protein